LTQEPINQVANTWAECFDSLIEAYEEIGEQIPMLRQYQSLFVESPQMQKVLGYIFNDIVEFHTVAIRFLANKLWRQLFKSLWKNNRTRYQHLLDALARHKALLQDQSRVLHFKQYQDDRIVHRKQLERIEEQNLRMMQGEIMRWLGSDDNIVSYEAARDARKSYPGTGQWILHHNHVQDWAQEEHPENALLWLNGMPGAGTWSPSRNSRR
jgi:hypothetical protein